MCIRWSLGMDNYLILRSTVDVIDYWSMLGLELHHVSKRAPEHCDFVRSGIKSLHKVH